MLDHLGVDLDGHDAPRARQQMLGEGALARADFNDEGLTGRARRRGDSFQDTGAGEEVLAELLPGHQPRTTMWSPTFLNVTRILPENGMPNMVGGSKLENSRLLPILSITCRLTLPSAQE